VESVTTVNETTTEALQMFFDANTVMPDAEPIEKREAVVQKAIEFAISRGCNQEDAEKLRAALIGLPNAFGEIVPGPMALVTWRVYMCDVSALTRRRDEIWQPMGGFLPVTGRNNQSYNIHLRGHSKEDPQICFGIAIQKKGSALMDEKSGAVKEQPYFWTYAGVVLQTEKRRNGKGEVLPGLPLSLSFDVNAAMDSTGKGKSVSGNWSRRLYLIRSTNPLTGLTETTNRLSDLVRGTNDELMFLSALIDAGLPVHTARVNRNPVTQSGQWQPRGQQQTQRQPQSLVAAGVSNGLTAPDVDPFADGSSE